MTDDQLLTDLAPDGTLVAAVNLGNPVLAQGSPDDPQGVTVELAREIARRLDVDLRFSCFDAARKSFAALTGGAATIAFLADEPARAAEVAFTRPYVLIDGVYAVHGSSSYRSPGEVDATGVRIGVKEGSAYDLFLTRTLQHATIVRGADGTTVFAEQGLASQRASASRSRHSSPRTPTCAWSTSRSCRSGRPSRRNGPPTPRQQPGCTPSSTSCW